MEGLDAVVGRAIVRHDPSVSTCVPLSTRSRGAKSFALENFKSEKFGRENHRAEISPAIETEKRKFVTAIFAQRPVVLPPSLYKKKKISVYYLYIRVDVYVRENAKKKKNTCFFSKKGSEMKREIASLYIVIDHFRGARAYVTLESIEKKNEKKILPSPKCRSFPTQTKDIFKRGIFYLNILLNFHRIFYTISL